MLRPHSERGNLACLSESFGKEAKSIAAAASYEAPIGMTWKSPGMTHLWCPKCQRQHGTDAELVFKDGKILFKWKCETCGSEILSEG